MNYTCENRNSTGTVYLNVVEPEKDITLLNVEIHFEKPCAPKPVIIRWQEACVDICAALRSNSSFERTLGPNWNKKRNPSRLASCAPIYSLQPPRPRSGRSSGARRRGRQRAHRDLRRRY